LPALPAHRGYLLVAEDHPVSQQLIQRQLAVLGLDCDIVDNGADAFDALSGHDYALLLTDCNMPGLSGYELATAWRRHEAQSGAARRLPIIAMTANALAGEAVRVREAGMDDVLAKPLQLLPLSQALGRWLPGNDLTAAGTNQDPARGGGNTPLAGMAEAEDGSALYADMLRAFTSASHDDLRELRRSVEHGDVAAAALGLHRLLGALQLFDDGPLLNQGRELLAALHGPAAENSLPRLSGYAAEVDTLLTKLNRLPANQGLG
jgi:CheY-like chemotaxis protein/HPt (histidine-containing phosphotransfer) domain-containing protein